MEQFSTCICHRQIKSLTVLCLFMFGVLGVTKAQNRNFGIVYSENLRGGVALFGNTLMHKLNNDGTPNIVAMNGNSANGTNPSYENGNGSIMGHIDIDGTTGDGAGTRNSSSADLILPDGVNTIKLARLYWGGRAVTTQFDMSLPANRTIKIRKGTTGAYQEYVAAQLDRVIQNPGVATEFSLYQAYVDVTDLVTQQGDGTYTVGNGAFSTGDGGTFGNYGAWSIVVVYENPVLNFNSVRVFDGFQQIYNGGSVTANSITLSGLNVPSGPVSAGDAHLGIVGWEGDARYNGDYLRINGSTFSNALNEANNSWNSTVTDNGVHVTTKNPNYTDQMGIDIDQFDVGTGYGILPNASSVILEFGTTQDQYFSGVVSFVIRMKDPIIRITKTVTDVNNNQVAEPGEMLTYKLKGRNVGLGNANLVVLTDSIPTTMTYIANSLKVNYGPGSTIGAKTDATGDDIAEYTAANRTVTFRMGTTANATTGGVLATTDSFEVEFQVSVNVPAVGTVPPLINVARIRAQSDAMINYVDDGTASIDGGSGNAPLPVTLTTFTASLQSTKLVKVSWSTSMEINAGKFEIERSTDGNNFKRVATVNAHGNSNVKLDYNITDDVSDVTGALVYYRLKQFDLDGKSTTSKTVSVRLKKVIGTFNISPNPFVSIVNVNVEWDKPEATVLKVFNAAGAEILSKKITLVAGNNNIVITELSGVPSGNYVIELNAPNRKLTKQLIRQQQ